jgi:uncharacterized protein YqgC (DUF456 family)
MTTTELLVAVAIALGLVGIVVPVLPGTLLILAAVLVWTVHIGTATAWMVLAAVTVLLATGAVLKYALPGRDLKTAGVPNRTLWVGGGVAILGFFVVPVVGLLLGFVLGVLLAELARVGSERAWPSTKAALRAVGLSVLLELITGLLAAVTWLVAALVV